MGVASKINDIIAKVNSNTSHRQSTANPHSVTKSQAGLGNVDNTSDVNKPISTATANALALKADVTYVAAELIEAEAITNSKINALAPYSGYTQVSKKLDNFVFQTSSSFLNKVADKNRFVKFGDKVVDTYGEELIVNGDFSDGTTGWSTGTNTVVGSKLKLTSPWATYTKAATGIKTYTVTFSVIADASNLAHFWIGSSSLTSNYLNKSSISTTGTYTFTFTANGNWYISIANASGIVYFDNISVKEIQTADFTNTVPEVAEIITNGSNTTSVAVNAGDYVVDGSELVTNGTTWDGASGTTPPNGWTSNGDATFSTDGSILTITQVSGNDGLYQEKNLLTYTDYLVTVTGLSGGYLVMYDGTIAYAAAYLKNVGNGTYKITTNGYSKVRLYIYDTDGTGAVSSIDNISVKRVSDTFRAKQDAPIGTALTNTTYFEDRTQIGVTNQALAYHAYNTLTKAYEGIKTEVLFSDVSKADLLDNSVWMARNGFSKVSQFLYSKGSYYVVPVGLWSSLNKGAYHPVLNPFGASQWAYDSNTSYNSLWYNVGTTPDNSTADAFTWKTLVSTRDGHYTSTSVSGRPDSKYYDICYPDQFIDVREYAKILNRDEVNLIIADKEENGVEEVVHFSYYYSGSATVSTTGTQDFIDFGTDVLGSGSIGDNSYVIGYIIDSVGAIFECVRINSGRYCYTADTTPNMTAGVCKIVVSKYKTKPILSSNTKLSIDLIGNPTNYPQVLKDRLASGVGVVGINPLLVGQDGNDCTTGVFSDVIHSNKITEHLSNQLQTISTGAWADWTAGNSLDLITNKSTSGGVITGYNALINYTSKNQPYIQSNPLPVIDVEPKVIASNSHSLYKVALIGNQVSGKIQVGNGANGYESNVLENADTHGYRYAQGYTNASLIVDVKKGDIIRVGYYYNTAVNGWSDFLVIALADKASVNCWWEIYHNTTQWKYLGNVTTPTHSTIALDNANSSASKWFKAISQGSNGVVGSVYGKELAYNSATTSFDGDNELFDQLTNSTKTDLNGNIVRCFHGVIPINGEVK